jgi:hypothetical protein
MRWSVVLCTSCQECGTLTDTYEAKAKFLIKYGFGKDDLFVKGEIFDKVIQTRIEDKS